MKAFGVLYVKELRAQRMVVALLLVATLGLGGYALSGVVDEPSPRLALAVLPFISAIGLPFLLIHAITSEWTGQTHYQILALPVSRSALFLAKVAMVLSVGLAIFLSSTAFLHLIAERLTAFIAHHDFPGVDGAAVPHVGGATLWAIAGIAYGVLLLPLLGIASAASGVRVMARRFKGGVTLAVFILGGYLYAKLLWPTVDLLKRVFGFSKWQLDVTLVDGVAPRSDAHVLLLFSVFFAVLGIGLGTLFFAKYVEA